MAVSRWNLALSLLALATPASPALAGRIWLDPNSRVPPGQPLVVTIEGLHSGQKALISVQENCGTGGPKRSQACPALWGPEESAARGQTVELLHTIAAERLATLPKDRALWVVVEAEGWLRPAISQFHLRDPCDAWRTLIESFTGGPCDLAVRQVLSNLTRSVPVLAGSIFEVQRLALDGQLTTVAGTRGATGVAWLSASSLLVTSAGGEDNLRAGLHRIDLESGTRETLWQPAEGEQPPAAPLALPDGRVAFVQQALGPQRLGDPDPAGELIIWQDGQTKQHLPLPYKVHQLLRSDPQGGKLIALSLGRDDAGPILLSINLVAPAGVNPVEILGFDNRLYQTLMREPTAGSSRAVVAFEEVRSATWRIGVAQGSEYVKDLVAVPERQALAPAWRPGGGEIAFLVEVD